MKTNLVALGTGEKVGGAVVAERVGLRASDEKPALRAGHRPAHDDDPQGAVRPGDLPGEVDAFVDAGTVATRFIEVDRANRPVDNLAAQIGRYGRLYRRPAEGRYAATHWTRRYRVFPNVLVVLAGRPDPNLERRRATLLALCRADPDLARSPELQVFVCLLPELKRHGPAATIFRTVTEPDRPADWLGQRPAGQGERP